MTTYTDKLHDEPVAPSHDANLEIEANLHRSNERFNQFTRTAYQNGSIDWEWQHADRMEALAEANFCEQRAQTLLLAEQTKLLSNALGCGYDLGLTLERIKDNTEATYRQRQNQGRS